MSGVQKQGLAPFIYTDQINYSSHIRSFVLSVLGICVLDYALFGLFYSFTPNIFTAWISITAVFLLIFFFLCRFSLKCYSSPAFIKRSHVLFQIVCFSTGLLLGINSIIITYYLIHEVPQLTGSHILTLTALLLTTSHIIALTFLTQHIRYFFLFFLPSVLPLIISHLLSRDHQHTLFYLAYYFTFFATLLCAHATFKIHKHLSQVLEKNKQLVDVAEAQSMD